MSGNDEHFTMTIHLGNDAMRTERDVARVLRAVARSLQLYGSPGTFQTIWDRNGNDVGRWKLGLVDVAGRAREEANR